MCVKTWASTSIGHPLQVLNSKQLLKDAMIGSFKVQFVAMTT